MSQHFIIQFRLSYLSSGRLQEVKRKRNFKLLALKVVSFACERWSLTRDSKCSDLTWNLLMFWKTGHRGEVVPTGGWSVLILNASVRICTKYSYLLAICIMLNKETKLFR